MATCCFKGATERPKILTHKGQKTQKRIIEHPRIYKKAAGKQKDRKAKRIIMQNLPPYSGKRKNDDLFLDFWVIFENMGHHFWDVFML